MPFATVNDVKSTIPSFLTGPIYFVFLSYNTMITTFEVTSHKVCLLLGGGGDASSLPPYNTTLG